MTFKNFLKRHWDEGVAYALAAIGALLSNNFEAFKGQGSVKLDFSLGRLGIALFLALMCVFILEVVPFTASVEDKESARKGKQKKLSLARRFLAAGLTGLASPLIAEKLIQAFVTIVGA